MPVMTKQQKNKSPGRICHEIFKGRSNSSRSQQLCLFTTRLVLKASLAPVRLCKECWLEFPYSHKLRINTFRRHISCFLQIPAPNAPEAHPCRTQCYAHGHARARATHSLRARAQFDDNSNAELAARVQILRLPPNMRLLKLKFQLYSVFRSQLSFSLSSVSVWFQPFLSGNSAGSQLRQTSVQSQLGLILISAQLQLDLSAFPNQ